MKVIQYKAHGGIVELEAEVRIPVKGPWEVTFNVAQQHYVVVKRRSENTADVYGQYPADYRGLVEALIYAKSCADK